VSVYPYLLNAVAGAAPDMRLEAFSATSGVAESAALKKWRCEVKATE
jgi:hypothetical protein